MDQDIRYWKQGEYLQNFGDFLSEYFLQHLFYAQPSRGQTVHVIGSCIDDMFVLPSDGSTLTPPSVFWGCGLRTQDGLSEDRFALAEILAVRGPLTRSALRLGESVPIGDPGLLLPALHKAATRDRPTGRSLLVPHFHEKRSDLELLESSGCDEILRPNLPNDIVAIDDFIERLVSARFVLTGSLHAAIAAAAYGRKFGYWNSGDIDLPFKWQDFSASINVPCVFHRHVRDAEAQYEADMAPTLRLPVLWPLLVAAPLPVRPDAFASVVELDVRRHGIGAFDIKVSSKAVNRLQSRLQHLLGEAESAVALRREAGQRDTTEREIRERVAALEAVEHMLQSNFDAAILREGHARDSRDEAQRGLVLAQQSALHLQEELETLQKEMRRVGAGVRQEAAHEVARLHAREAHLLAEEARLHRAIAERDHALAVTEAALLAEQRMIAGMRGTTSWRLAAPVRKFDRAIPWLGQRLRRVLRLLRLVTGMQLASRMRRKRQIAGEAQDLAASALFDDAFYRTEHRGVAATREDAARHYVTIGAAAGFAPNPMFDGAWYTATYRTQGDRKSTPLWHYIQHGAKAGYDPHPMFDTAWYVAQTPQAGGPAGALQHYLQIGAPAGLAPNRLFDVKGYLCEYSDVHDSGRDPVQHYLREGAARGHDPHAFFDTDWYVATYPDARASTMNPLAFHLRHGLAAGYGTSPLLRHLAGFTLEDAVELPSWDAPEVSILIPAYGHYFDTLRCLQALNANSSRTVSFETIVIDDNPARPIAPLLAGIKGVRVECNAENLGFLHSCNRASTLASGWQLVFLNNDTIVCKDWLQPLVDLVRGDPQIGMVGCKLLNTDGTVQEAGGILFDDGWGFAYGVGDDAGKPEYNYVRRVDLVTGAAFLVRRSLFDARRGFDTRYAPAFYEEFDLALQVREAGYDVVYQPRSEVIHLGSSSYGPEMRDRQSLRNHAQFCLKWEDVLERQPMRDTDLFLARQRPGQSATILMIDDRVPEWDRHAGALTVLQYITLLRQMGMRLVFAPADGVARQPYTQRLQDMGVEILSGARRLEDWMCENGSHLLAVWTARPDVTSGLLDMLRRNTKASILYYPHDLHYLREKRRYDLTGDLDALAETHRVKQLEKRIFGAVDYVMTPSAEEAPVISRLAPGAQVRVLPPYLYPMGSAMSHDAAHFAACTSIMFVGGFNHTPNVDAVLWLVHDIMPIVWNSRPGTKLMIVGADPTAEMQALASDSIEITGQVAELDPYFACARLLVAPLRYGAGVKGKVVSSLQAGVPVVTTAIGNEGIALQDGTEVLLGDTPEALAAQILRLLDDEALCAALSQAGAEVIGARFSEAKARDALLDILCADKCTVCGKFSVGAPNAAPMPDVPWSERIACDRCEALNRMEALSQVILSAVRHTDVADLRSAARYMSGQRIHAFPATGPIAEELRTCPLFTCSACDGDEAAGPQQEGDLAPQDLANIGFRDGELDLLVGQYEQHSVASWPGALAEIFRVLKPGGRHVFTMSRPQEGLEALLETAGFEVHGLAFSDRDAPGEPVTVFDTRRAAEGRQAVLF